MPFCKLARYGGNARIFAGNEVILKETATWKMTTTLNNLQTCFQIRAFEFDASKIGQFLKGEAVPVPLLSPFPGPLGCPFYWVNWHKMHVCMTSDIYCIMYFWLRV